MAKCLPILLTISFTLLSLTVSGSETSADIAAGTSVHQGEDGNPWVSVSARVAFQYRKAVLIVRSVRDYRARLATDSGGLRCDSRTWEWAIMAGPHVSRSDRSFGAELAAGVGRMSGVGPWVYAEGNYYRLYRPEFESFGWALHAAVFRHRWNLTASSNLNGGQSYIGLHIGYRFGPWPLSHKESR